MSGSWTGGREFDPKLRGTFFLVYFCLSPLQKHVRKSSLWLWKESCFSTGVRKPGNTCASPTAIWPWLLRGAKPKYNQQQQFSYSSFLKVTWLVKGWWEDNLYISYRHCDILTLVVFVFLWWMYFYHLLIDTSFHTGIFFHVSINKWYNHKTDLFFLFNPFPNKPWFLRVGRTSLENTVGKGEIARNKQFLLFPQCFLPVWRTFCHFLTNLKLPSANSFSLEESKICRLGKG